MGGIWDENYPSCSRFIWHDHTPRETDTKTRPAPNLDLNLPQNEINNNLSLSDQTVWLTAFRTKHKGCLHFGLFACSGWWNAWNSFLDVNAGSCGHLVVKTSELLLFKYILWLNRGGRQRVLSANSVKVSTPQFFKNILSWFYKTTIALWKGNARPQRAPCFLT